ncbi:MAG TPA: hypothetical protein VJT50_15830 [Pyrinomonadaceae bacterium]|nr:hypothetical protein [Pyrinomonadaceae bacterium]
MESYISPVAVSQDGKCIYTVSMLQRFTNVSVKSGHIDRANITSWSEDALPEYKMVEIDKDQMSWKDQKNIQLRFTVTLDSTSVAKLSERKEPLEIEIRYYDNTGKLLNIADDNMPIYFYVNLTEPAVRITHLPNLNEQMVH